MADPTVLGFDTSGPYCGAALLKGGQIVAAGHEDMGRGQAERLMGLLEEVLAAGGTTWAELDRIGVGIGPGNFTGIRISVSAARGLALGRGIPAVGVSVLDALACGSDGPVLACLSAPRGAAYVAGHRTRAVIAPALVTPDEIPTTWAEDGLTCIGTAAEDIAPLLGAGTAPASYAPASAIARIAARRAIRPDERPAPLYLRPADAAPPSQPAPVIVP